jgi:PAS domain S-box-containing protein
MRLRLSLRHKIWLLTLGVILLIALSDILISIRMINRSIDAELTRDAHEIRALLMATRRVYHQAFLDAGLPVNNKTLSLLPAHALARISGDFSNWSKNGLYFNNVSDTPRNPKNQADALETTAIDWFRTHPNAEERTLRTTNVTGEPIVHYTAPIWVEPYCLRCHGEIKDAPEAIQQRYQSSYDRHPGDLMGVMSIKLPVAPLAEREWDAWRMRFGLRLLGYGILLFLINQLMRRLVIKRLEKITVASHSLAAGDYSARVQLQGQDELASLGRDFNAMAEAIELRNQAVFESREAQKREGLFIDNILNNADSLIIAFDVQGKVLRINRRIEEFSGYRQEEVVGRPFWDFFLPEQERPRVMKVFEQLTSGHLVSRFENAWRTRDGRERLFEWSNALVLGDQGQIEYIISLGYDIQERKAAENEVRRLNAELESRVANRTQRLELTNLELAQARDAAEAANQAKSIFLSNMSHELRTPLNAVLGFSELMARDPTVSPGQREHLEVINRSGQHLLAMINDVLDLSKIEAGRIELKVETLDVHRLLEDLATMFRIRTQNKDLGFLLEPAPDLPRYLAMDGGKLRQILINLLGNAIKFTKTGGIALRARAEFEGEYGWLHFEVQDSGSGISTEHLLHIFEPFTQLEENEQPGSGLGLAISRRLVQLMGGDIQAKSSLGEGSTFSFRVRAQIAEAPASNELTAFEEVDRLEPGQTNIRVLVVDDKSENRELLSQLLASVGFEVREAANGETALEVFQAWRPDLVWMDMRMPVMDGYEATRRLRRLPGGKDVKILAVTASAFEEQRSRIFAAGCDDLIHKPYRPEQIFSAMAKHLGVRFETRTKAPIIDTTKNNLDWGQIGPAEIAAIKEAAEQLDTDRIQALAATIETKNAPLAQHLRELAADFRFDLICSDCERQHIDGQ